MHVVAMFRSKYDSTQIGLMKRKEIFIQLIFLYEKRNEFRET